MYITLFSMYIVYTDICFNLCAVLRVSRFMQPSFCPWFSCKYFAFMPSIISDFYSYGVYLRLFDLFFSGVYCAPIIFANVTTLNSLNIFNFEFKPLSFSSNSSIVSFFSPLLFFHEAACSFYTRFSSYRWCTRLWWWWSENVPSVSVEFRCVPKQKLFGLVFRRRSKRELQRTREKILLFKNWRRGVSTTKKKIAPSFITLEFPYFKFTLFRSISKTSHITHK